MCVRRTLGSALATAVITGTACAEEMIVDGGFETGDLTGWTRRVWPGSSGDIRVVGAGNGFLSGMPQIGRRTGLADGFSSAAPLQTFFAGPAAAGDRAQAWQPFGFDLTSLLAAPV